METEMKSRMYIGIGMEEWNMEEWNGRMECEWRTRTGRNKEFKLE